MTARRHAARRRPRPEVRLVALLAATFVLLLLAGLATGLLGTGGGPGPVVTGSPIPSPAPGVPTEAPSPSPAPTIGPMPTPASTQPPEPTPYLRAPFAMDIYREGTFVSQIDKLHCMSAAMQNMLNLIGPEVDTSADRQRALAALAERLSTDTIGGGPGPVGWADGLTRLTGTAYEVRVYRTRAAALRAAVTALRETGRPVGLLAWRGAHSWVLTGFRATADPAFTLDYAVSGYDIVDPWYPRVSSIWGASKPPDTLRTPAEMVYNFLAWKRPEGRYPARDGRWILVKPVDPTPPGAGWPPFR